MRASRGEAALKSCRELTVVLRSGVRPGWLLQALRGPLLRGTVSGTRHLRPSSLPRHLLLRRFCTHVQPTLDPSSFLELHASAAYIAFHVAGGLQLHAALRRDRAGNASGNDEILRLDIAGYEAVFPHYDRLRSSDDALYASFDPDDPVTRAVANDLHSGADDRDDIAQISAFRSVLLRHRLSFSQCGCFSGSTGPRSTSRSPISGTHQLQGVYHPASPPCLEVQVGSRRLSRAPGERYHLEHLDGVTLGHECPGVVTV